MFASKFRYEAYGVIGLVLIALLVVLVVAAYNQAFSRFVMVSVRADRAGLLLQTGADVSLHSVRVGTIAAVAADGMNGALVTVRLDPAEAKYIPANVTAQIVSPTLFGPKYVDLVKPAQPVAEPIASGATVRPAVVQVEANDVFQNLIGLLDGVHPAKVNAGLGALSTALQGRGRKMGDYLTQLNDYLRAFNPHLPELRQDLATAPGVIDAYADSAPAILQIVRNFTTTSRSITELNPELDNFLHSLDGFGEKTAGFLDRNHEPLASALEELRPTTATLERYSPIFPCFFAAMNHEREIQEPSFGGVVPGLRTLTSFQPGIGAYSYPENLPKLGVDEPSCFGGTPPGTTIPRHVSFDDGSPDLKTRDRPVTPRVPSLATLLFGAAAGAANR